MGELLNDRHTVPLEYSITPPPTSEQKKVFPV
jgi:hypothetical protein